jgi:hypothetical protein
MKPINMKAKRRIDDFPPVELLSWLDCDRGGDRTRGPRIKSALLYH